LILLGEFPVRGLERLRVVRIDGLRQTTAPNEPLEGQEERIRGQITTKFQVDGTYCCALEERNIAFSQK